jgi:L-iditol 2-dehydrogenase
MKAAVVEEPGRLVIRDLPEPGFGPYQARCQLLFGSVCTGTDRHVVAGDFPFPIAYPAILGHESVGRITDVGSRVRYLKPGDLVTRVGTPPIGRVQAAWGGFAEVGIATDHRAMREDGLPERDWRPYRIHQIVPDDIDPAGAPMIITWRETLSYLTRAGIHPGSHLLIIGSGGNGIAFAAHAANLGAEVVAVVGSARRADVARRAGATDYYDYASADLDSQLRTGHSDGFHLLIDAVGRRDAVNRRLRHLRPGGTVGIYGLDEWGSITIDPAAAPGTFTFYNDGYDEAEVHHDVIRSIQSGQLESSLWFPTGTPVEFARLPDVFHSLSSAPFLKALVRLAPTATATDRYPA